jgi:hypothetical protein
VSRPLSYIDRIQTAEAGLIREVSFGQASTCATDYEDPGRLGQGLCLSTSIQSLGTVSPSFAPFLHDLNGFNVLWCI